MATSGDGVIPFVRFGAVDLDVGSLEVFWLDAYSGGVFVPFRDSTAGKTTYGGGRYLLDTAKSADLGVIGDELILDFRLRMDAYEEVLARIATDILPHFHD